MSAPQMSRAKRIAWLVILFIPFFVSMWVPLFNRVEPSLYGIPFFYWFQFGWVVVAAAVTALVYRVGL